MFKNNQKLKLNVSGSSGAPPAIAGLTVGIAFIISVALVENSLASNSLHTRPPNMVLVVDGKQYLGQNGPYCIRNGCADYGFSVPPETILVEKGSEVSARTSGLQQPTQLRWVNAIDIGDPNNEFHQEMIAERLKNAKFNIDLSEGEYVLSIEARWEHGYSAVPVAVYSYHIRVV